MLHNLPNFEWFYVVRNLDWSGVSQYYMGSIWRKMSPQSMKENKSDFMLSRCFKAPRKKPSYE